MRFNFTDVKTGFDPIPGGTYEASVFSLKEKMSSNGNPMLEWCFTVDEGEFEGRRVFTNTVLMEKTLWRLKLMLAGFGLAVDDEIEFEPEDLIGEVCLITVTQRTAPDGTTRNDISKTMPIGEE